MNEAPCYEIPTCSMPKSTYQENDKGVANRFVFAIF
jgi:hypothetical protein